VLIRIEERVPVAVVDAGGAELWLVDRFGVWLGERTAEDESLVTIRAIDGLTPAGGRRSSSPELANAIAVARGLSDELKSVTRAISAPSVERTAIITDDDVEVFIGEADGIADKDRVAREILEREKGKVVYINVRVVERPTWRGLE
jgi:cell division protein FtsQ